MLMRMFQVHFTTLHCKAPGSGSGCGIQIQIQIQRHYTNTTQTANSGLFRKPSTKLNPMARCSTVQVHGESDLRLLRQGQQGTSSKQFAVPVRGAVYSAIAKAKHARAWSRCVSVSVDKKRGL
jgi:hypothetical protein